MITNTHKQHIVGLSSMCQYGLETVSLVRSETAADAVFVLSTALEHLVTLTTHVSQCQARVGVTTPVTKYLRPRTDVALVICQHCLALD